MRFMTGMVAAALFAAFSFAAEATYTLNGENTKLEFTGTKKDGKHDGGFKKLNGKVSLAGEITTLKLEVEIDTDSLYTDTEKLTTHLKSADFFDVKTNPTAKFVTGKIEKTGEEYKITGELTLNGKTKEISFTGKIATGETLTLSSKFKINRNDFGVSYGKGKIDDDVEIRLNVEAKK